MSDSPLIQYAKDLISIRSTSYESNEPVAELMRSQLEQLGFEIEPIPYLDPQGTRKLNLVARRGTGTGGVAYFGHNDCVPVDTWTGPGGPFDPTVDSGRLYGRGSCDMKGSLAAMLEAARITQTLATEHPVYYICTADEEVGYLGAQAVVAHSELYRELVQGEARAIIGEATALQVVHAHKGGVGLRAVARGIAAHSSTRHGRNANLAMIPFLTELKTIYDEVESDPKWQNPDFDPPTLCLNIGINDGNTAVNITAPQSVCTLYFRPMPGVDIGPLLKRIETVAAREGIELETLLDGPPVYTDPQSPIVQELLALIGESTSHVVSYATDACIFTDIDPLVVFGPGDIAQAHTDDEWVEVTQLERAAELYAQMIRRWCCD